MPPSKKDLDTDLNNIDRALCAAIEGLTKALTLTYDVESEYDLYDFSVDNLQKWKSRVEDVLHTLNQEYEEFETFAFDGDSIREVDEDDETE